MIPVLVAILAFADLSAVKSEPDLNRRSELALTHAGTGFPLVAADGSTIREVRPE